MVFYRQDCPYYQDRPYYQGRPITIRWNLVESYAVTIKVGFLLESASFNNEDDKVLESNNKVEFL